MHTGKVFLTVVVLGIALATGWFAQGARAQESVSNILYAPLISNLNPIPINNLRALLVSDRDGNEELYLAPANGQNAIRLTTNLVTDNGPLLSPNRRTILYRSGSTEADTSLFLINADGTNPRQLVGLSGFETNYQWSPDSTQILFHAGSVTDTTLYVIPASGGIPSVIAEQVYPSSAWSPDGNLIGYSTNSTGDYEVWVVKPDGTGALQLSNNITDEYFVDWLLGGTEMLVNTFNGNDNDIYRYKSDGTGFKGAIVNASNTVAVEVSPNGHYWVYTDQNSNVGIVDTYGGAPVVVANNCTGTTCRLSDFTWYPHNNEEVAYTFYQSFTTGASSTAIYRVRFRQPTPQAELFIPDADVLYWSPNPRYVLYIQSVPAPAGQPDYYYPVIRDLDTGAETKLGTETTRTSFRGWTFGDSTVDGRP